MSCVLLAGTGARLIRVRADAARARKMAANVRAESNAVSVDAPELSSRDVAVAESKRSVEQRLRGVLVSSGIRSYEFRRVPSDYYQKSFEERREILGAASVDHLCKSMVMVNTQAPAHITDCSDRNNSKYYVIVVQYTARLNAEKVKKFIYDLNEGRMSKKRINLRLAPEEESERLSGFMHNAVSPIGMRTDIPVIMSDAIANLKPDFFWLGGGEVDLKLGINTHEFVGLVKPFIIDCTYSEI